MTSSFISPYIREGSGLKPSTLPPTTVGSPISPYIREGSGLKQIVREEMGSHSLRISPYIREGSGLKQIPRFIRVLNPFDLPLHP